MSPGSKEHKQNMEYMASEVCKCIGNAVYNEKPIQCFRGIGAQDKFVFNDKSSSKLFSLLFDERRREDETTYEPVRNDILEYLENVWHVEKNFKGGYSKDYHTLTSSKRQTILLVNGEPTGVKGLNSGTNRFYSV